MPIFNLNTLLNQSYKLLKDNLYDFITIGFLQSLLGLLLKFSLKWIDNFNLLVLILLAIIVLVFQTQLTLILITLITDRSKNIKSSLFECYMKSKNKLKRYLSSSVMLTLFMTLPIILLFFISSISNYYAIKILSSIIGGTIALYIFLQYYLAPIITVLNPEIKLVFNESSELLKNKKLISIYVLLTIVLISYIPTLFLKFIEVEGIVANIITALTNSFIIPLDMCITLFFYNYLKKNRE